MKARFAKANIQEINFQMNIFLVQIVVPIIECIIYYIYTLE
jgi:hypothetical protein